MTRAGVVLSVVAIVFAVSPAGGQERVSVTDPEVAAEIDYVAAQVRREFDRQLYDYATARFVDVVVRVRRMPAGMSVRFCGKVNAKNLNGAYVGWREFAGGAVKVPGQQRLTVERPTLRILPARVDGFDPAQVVDSVMVRGDCDEVREAETVIADTDGAMLKFR